MKIEMVTALSLLAILIAGMFLATMSAAIVNMREVDEKRAHRLAAKERRSGMFRYSIPG